jgi:hypothetical protein
VPLSWHTALIVTSLLFISLVLTINKLSLKQLQVQ